jgi:hypothetical protein
MDNGVFRPEATFKATTMIAQRYNAGHGSERFLSALVSAIVGLTIHAERELRLDHWRVFYYVREDGSLVIVTLIGQERGNKLFIAGEEFEL